MELEEVETWASGIEALLARVAERFARPQPRQRALAYLKGLLIPVEHKMSWPLGDYAGKSMTEAMQQPLATYQ